MKSNLTTRAAHEAKARWAALPPATRKVRVRQGAALLVVGIVLAWSPWSSSPDPEPVPPGVGKIAAYRDGKCDDPGKIAAFLCKPADGPGATDPPTGTPTPSEGRTVEPRDVPEVPEAPGSTLVPDPHAGEPEDSPRTKVLGKALGIPEHEADPGRSFQEGVDRWLRGLADQQAEARDLKALQERFTAARSALRARGGGAWEKVEADATVTADAAADAARARVMAASVGAPYEEATQTAKAAADKAREWAFAEAVIAAEQSSRVPAPSTSVPSPSVTPQLLSPYGPGTAPVPTVR